MNIIRKNYKRRIARNGNQSSFNEFIASRRSGLLKAFLFRLLLFVCCLDEEFFALLLSTGGGFISRAVVHFALPSLLCVMRSRRGGADAASTGCANWLEGAEFFMPLLTSLLDLDVYCWLVPLVCERLSPGMAIELSTPDF